MCTIVDIVLVVETTTGARVAAAAVVITGASVKMISIKI